MFSAMVNRFGLWLTLGLGLAWSSHLLQESALTAAGSPETESAATTLGASSTPTSAGSSLALAIASPLLPAPPQVDDEQGRVEVVLKDGRRFRGTLILRDRLRVVLRIAAIDTTFPEEDVAEIRPLKSFEQQYQELKSRIRPDDFAERYRFCQWIHGRHRLELAATELEALLDDYADYEAARQLLRRVNSEIQMQPQERAGTDTGPPPKQQQRHTIGRDPDRVIPTRMLTDDQINLLKVYEVDLADPPRMLIPRETIDMLIQEHKQSKLLPQTPEERRLFYQRQPAEILDIIFRLQARHLYGDIRVLGEPAALNKFRLNVHRSWLINSCATTSCHGGTEAGKLFLFNRRPHSVTTAYTNFLILDRSELNGQPMLDYEHPAASHLLQLGLPRGRASSPHPDVPGWKPVFRNKSDSLFGKAVDWLGSMYHPRPEYPIDYDPPRIRPRGELTRDQGGGVEDDPLDNNDEFGDDDDDENDAGKGTTAGRHRDKPSTLAYLAYLVLREVRR